MYSYSAKLGAETTTKSQNVLFLCDQRSSCWISLFKMTCCAKRKGRSWWYSLTVWYQRHPLTWRSVEGARASWASLTHLELAALYLVSRPLHMSWCLPLLPSPALTSCLTPAWALGVASGITSYGMSSMKNCTPFLCRPQPMIQEVLISLFALATRKLSAQFAGYQ